MKICNFRPLVCLALLVMVAIASAMYAWWLALMLAVILFAVLWCLKLPTQFKVVALAVFIIAMFSCLLTAALVADPQYPNYDTQHGLRGQILGYARWYLRLFLTPDHAEIVYAMLFGDKSMLPVTIKNNFSVAGLAHILTVSGFHIDLFYVIVCSLLKICRVPKRLHIWIVSPVLIFYGYLCAWRYAVTRAVIMCLTYAIAKRKLYVADSLSVLSLAAIIILILHPYALLSASFWLSFSCVLGIYFWYGTIYKTIPVKSVAMYLSVTLGSFPFIVYFFGAEPVFGLVADVVLLPLLVLTFYCGLFAVVTFVCGAVLYLVQPILNLVNWVTSAIAQISWAKIPLQHNLAAILVYMLMALVLSRFIFLNRKVKSVLAVALFSCYLVLLVF